MDNNNINVNSPEYQKMMQEKMAKLRMQNSKDNIQEESINQKIGSNLANNERYQQSQPIMAREEEERSLENQEEKSVPENFKELEREEQIALLKEYMERLSEELNEAHKQEVIDGKYEVRDISYNELNDGSIVLDVEVMKDGELVHEQFNKDLNKIDIENEIETLRENGKLTPELENQMLARKQELEDIKDNPEKISLNELEVEKTLEDDEKREQIEKDAEQLGINKDEINGKNVEKDKDGDLKFKETMLAKYNTITYFDGKCPIDDKGRTLNEAIGQKCDQYAIYQSENGWKFTGIQDGKLIDLSDKTMQRSGQQNLSYEKLNGQAALAASSFMVGFRNNNNIYWLGMGQENGRQFSYLGREGLEHEGITVQELPKSKPSSRVVSEKERNAFSPVLNNEEVDKQNKDMKQSVQDNKGGKTDELLYEKELIEQKAKEANVNEDLLQELVDEDQKQGRDNGQTLEETIDENIEEIKEKQQSLNDHGERDIFTEMEEEHLRNLHKPNQNN